MKRILTSLLSLLAIFAFLPACGTEDIPPGNKGFIFDRTGALALYSGGDGLETDSVLQPGTHYTGLYDEVRDINCKDDLEQEYVDVLTKSDLTVKIDIRVTYAADCTTKEQMVKILDQVGSDGQTIEPEVLYQRYILPIIRESLRTFIASINVEDVKNVRVALGDQIRADLQKSIAKLGDPVIIKHLTVSDMVLPPEIVEKNRQIELARQDAEQEREKQNAAKYRLERELFEAQEDRKVQKEAAERDKEVQEINAERDKQVSILRAEAVLEAKKREAEGVRALRAELTGPYLDYLKTMKDAEVRSELARSMGAGTVWYIGPDFLVPPGTPASVAVPR